MLKFIKNILGLKNKEPYNINNVYDIPKECDRIQYTANMIIKKMRTDGISKKIYIFSLSKEQYKNLRENSIIDFIHYKHYYNDYFKCNIIYTIDKFIPFLYFNHNEYIENMEL